ncbi:MAG: hypothetical protein JWR21_889 [Herminiimonas sp.]|nr:hypothetical protein [Herminiimonas sp.]
MSAPGLTNRKFAELEDCDEKQVRRGIESGKLKLGTDGLLDPALVKSGWRRPIRSSKIVADVADKVEKSPKTVRSGDATVRDDDTPAQAAAKLIVAFGASHDLTEAIRIKENFNALLKKLEYEQKAGALVDFATAEAVLFEEFRAQRDSWLNWPARIGPIVAADLGLEADKVTEVLTAHVHQHIAQLGEPEPEFGERKG